MDSVKLHNYQYSWIELESPTLVALYTALQVMFVCSQRVWKGRNLYIDRYIIVWSLSLLIVCHWTILWLIKSIICVGIKQYFYGIKFPFHCAIYIYHTQKYLQKWWWLKCLMLFRCVGIWLNTVYCLKQGKKNGGDD